MTDRSLPYILLIILALACCLAVAASAVPSPVEDIFNGHHEEKMRKQGFHPCACCGSWTKKECVKR